MWQRQSSELPAVSAVLKATEGGDGPDAEVTRLTQHGRLTDTGGFIGGRF